MVVQWAPEQEGNSAPLYRDRGSWKDCVDKGVQYSKYTDTLIIQMSSWRREENMVRHLKGYPFNLKFQQLSITLYLLDWTQVSDFISFVTNHW